MKNTYTQKRNTKKRAFFFGLFGSLLILLGIVIFWDSSRSDRVTVTPPTISADPVQAVAGKKVFSTDYYDIELDADWTYLDDFSIEDSRYRYSLMDNDVLKATIKILIDDRTEQEVERILPITLNSDGAVSLAGQVTEHCAQQEKEDITIGKQAKTMAEVRFLCDVDGNAFTVAAGQVGGTIRLPVSGDSTVTVIYQDATASPSSNGFVRALQGLTLK